MRLVCEEKGAEYRLVEIDIMQGAHKAPEHLARHPFGRVPAFEHDGFALYETSAITRYLDAVLPGPSLTPGDPKGAARMQQAIAVVDNYAYGAMISAVVIQRVVMPMVGGTTDEAVIAAALPTAEIVAPGVRGPARRRHVARRRQAQPGRPAPGAGHGLLQRHARGPAAAAGLPQAGPLVGADVVAPEHGQDAAAAGLREGAAPRLGAPRVSGAGCHQQGRVERTRDPTSGACIPPSRCRRPG